MNKKILMICLDVILYVIGFPILMVLAIIESLPYFEMGLYGLTGAIPIILVALAWVATGITELVIRLIAKKKMESKPDKKKALRNQGLRMIIAIFCCLTIFTCFLDLVLPSLLDTATQGTIKYEDILLDDQSQNELQRELFDRFIDWNVENGNLQEKTLEKIESEYGTSAETIKQTFLSNSKKFRSGDNARPAWNIAPLYSSDGTGKIKPDCFTAKYKEDIVKAYKDEALKNEEVATVLKKCFNTIDAAYKSFDPLSIELALANMDYLFAYNKDWLNDIVVTYYGDEKGNASRSNSNELIKSDYYYRWCILDLIGEIPQNDTIESNFTLLQGMWDLPGTDYADAATHNQIRGSLDYMKMAWLDSISLLGIISITSMRNWFFLFAAIIMVASLVRYFIVRPYYYGINLISGDEETIKTSKKDNAVLDEKAQAKADAKAAKDAAKAEAKAAKEAAKAEAKAAKEAAKAEAKETKTEEANDNKIETDSIEIQTVDDGKSDDKTNDEINEK